MDGMKGDEEGNGARGEEVMQEVERKQEAERRSEEEDGDVFII